VIYSIKKHDTLNLTKQSTQIKEVHSVWPSSRFFPVPLLFILYTKHQVQLAFLPVGGCPSVCKWHRSMLMDSWWEVCPYSVDVLHAASNKIVMSTFNQPRPKKQK